MATRTPCNQVLAGIRVWRTAQPARKGIQETSHLAAATDSAIIALCIVLPDEQIRRDQTLALVQPQWELKALSVHRRCATAYPLGLVVVVHAVTVGPPHHNGAIAWPDGLVACKEPAEFDGKFVLVA